MSYSEHWDERQDIMNRNEEIRKNSIMTEEQRQTVARVGFATFIQVMTKASEHLGMEFKVRKEDEERIDFDLDGYQFTLGWGEVVRQSIDGGRWVVQYTLSTWHMENMNSRWSPPELVDREVMVGQSVWDCVQKAFETVYMGKVSGVLEGIGNMMQIEDEKNAEW
jgi:hypothetical protein